MITRINEQTSEHLNLKAIFGKKRQKGYWAMSRGHSCVLGMKTQCMRTKSSTAGSDRAEENNKKRGGKKERKEGSSWGFKSREQNIENTHLSAQHLQYSTLIWYLVHWGVCLFSLTPGSAQESFLVFLKSQCICRKQENMQWLCV